jgi:Ca2+-binding RTX toxin-like protein
MTIITGQIKNGDASSEVLEADVVTDTSDPSETVYLVYDQVNGDGGDDVISSVLDGSGFPDYSVTLTGGDGNDTITGGSGSDTLYGDDGNDVVDGAGGDDWISLSGNYSSGSSDTVFGGEGADTIVGSFDYSGQSASIDGGGGDDTIDVTGAETTVTVTGGDGTDTFVASGSFSAASSLDVEIIKVGNVTVDADFFDGAQTLVGAAGYSSVDITLSSDGSFAIGAIASGLSGYVSGSTGADTVDVSAADASWTIYGGDGDDTITGGSGADVLSGDDGSDVIDGGDGDDQIDIGGNYTNGTTDILLGGDGADTIGGSISDENQSVSIDGGSGDDTIDISGANSNVTVTGGDGTDTFAASGSFSAASSLDVEIVKVGYVTVDADFFDGAQTLVGADGYSSAQITLSSDGSFAIGAIASGLSGFVSGSTGADTVDVSAADASWTVYGGDGDDTITGGSGADVLSGDGGSDVVDGGDGDDQIALGDNYIEGTADTVFGGAGADTISASVNYEGQSVSIDGGAGDDNIDIYGSNSTITVTGGADIDTVVASGSFSAASSLDVEIVKAAYLTVDADFFDGAQTLVGADGYSSVDITLSSDGSFAIGAIASGLSGYVSGSTGADTVDVSAADASWTVNGGDGDDTITGGSGADVLSGDGGSDVVDGGDGDDQITLGDNYTEGTADTVFGGAGADTISASVSYEGQSVSIDGGAGDDIIDIYGSNSTITVTGGADIDTVVASGSFSAASSLDVEIVKAAYLTVDADFFDGAQTLVGADGYSSVDITLSSDGSFAIGAIASGLSGYVSGSTGADTVDVSAADASWTVNGGDGDDTITGGSGDDDLTGGGGSDLVSGGDGKDNISITDYYGVGTIDIVQGGDGDDSIYGYLGGESQAVSIDGGVGDDNINVSGYGSTVTISGGAGVDTAVLSGDFTAGSIVDVEVLEISSISADADFFDSVQTLAGGNDDDGGVSITLTSDGSFEVGAIESGLAGYVDGSSGNDVVDLSAADTGWTVYGNGGDDTISGGGGDDNLYGDAGADVLAGGMGADRLIGDSGDDDLSGGDGGDTLNGGEGNDDLHGGHGSDIYHYSWGDETDTIFETDSGAESSGVNIDTDAIVLGYGITEDDVAIRQSGGDLVIAIGGEDAIVIDGFLEGLSNQVEELRFDDGTVWNLPQHAGITTEGDDTVYGSSADDTIDGRGGNDLIYGEGGNDHLDGGTGNDTVFGGSGNDTLVQSGGDDELDGGSGDDTYVYLDGTMEISDASGQDTLDLSGAEGPAIIDMSTGGAVNGQTITLVGGSVGGAAGGPLQIVFSQDLTGSFGDDLPMVLDLVPQIIDAIRVFDPSATFGLTSFMDKPIEPFGDAEFDYAYATNLALTSNIIDFLQAYNALNLGGGSDGPESQLEAALQIALRTSEIGWTADGVKIAIILTDAPPHVAGDGASGGISTPNDGDAVLDGTPASTGEDYPGFSQLADALRAAGITPIYAVTDGSESVYQDMVEDAGFGAVVTLNSDSSNIVEVIQSSVGFVTGASTIENVVGTRFGDQITGTVIDNKIDGGEGDDTLAGGGGNDEITGGKGDDKIDGGLGVDTAVFSGTRADYQITENTDGSTTIVDLRGEGFDGTDQLNGIEILKFSDETEGSASGPENLQLSGGVVDSDARAGSVVGLLSAYDADGDALTFTLVGDSASIFEIVGNELRVKADIDLDPASVSTISVIIKATDPTGLSTLGSFALSVEDINSPPENLALSANAIDENAAVGSVIGLLSASDHEGDAITYSLVDDAGGRFTIVGNELRVAGPIDYELTSSLSVVVAAIDALGNVTEQSFDIEVGDVDEIPSTGRTSLVNGLGGDAGFGEFFVAPNDDGSSSAIDISSVFQDGINFFGSRFENIYVNNNGNITFNGGLSTYTPFGIAGSAIPIIAPFFSDVDTRSGSVVPTEGGTSAGSNLVWYDVDAAAGVVTITWDDVGYFSNRTDSLNAFQMQLIDTGDGNFSVIFRYEDVNWTTGDASGGVGGHSGTVASAGYSAGDGVHYVELPQSRIEDSMLSLDETAGNTGSVGVWRFDVVNGVVAIAPVATGDVVDLASGGAEPIVIDVLANDYDPDSGAVTIEAISSDPTQGVASIVDGKIVYTHSGSGFYSDSLSYVVRDDEGVTTTGLVTITYNNDAPSSVDAGAELRANEVHHFSPDDFAFADANGNLLQGVKIVGLPSIGALLLNGVAVTENQVVAAADISGLSWSAPAEIPVGEDVAFNFAVVDDGGTAFGGKDTDETANIFTFNIVANNAPTGAATAALVDGVEDQDYIVSAADLLAGFTDAEGDSLSVFDLSASNGADIIDNDDGTFTIKAIANFNGAFDLTYTVGDGFGGATSGLVSLRLGAVNDAPIVQNPIPGQSVAEDGAWSFTVPVDTFADVDGDALTYSASLAGGATLPEWLSFEAGTFSGVPPKDFNGPLNLVVTASDGVSNVAADFVLDVTPENDAPVLVAAIADQIATAGAAWSFLSDEAFGDVDGDELTYAATLSDGSDLPGWLIFDPTTGAFSGTPDDADIGVVSVTVTASDGALSASDTFDINIVSPNSAPTGIKLSGGKIAEDAESGDVAGRLKGIDPDAGDTLTFSIIGGAKGMFEIVDDEILLADGKTLDFETKSSYSLTVRVTDAAGLSFDKDITIKVTDVEEAIVGTAKNDRLKGTSGDDVLRGLRGNDILEGLAGADELDGGNGSDTASYASAKVGVIASLVKPGRNTGDADGDSYISIENLLGSKFADKLTGNKNDNELDGGMGNDILTGAGGSDLFIFGAKYGKDTIKDFSGAGKNHDVIDLSDAVGIVSFKDLKANHLSDIGDDLMITANDGSKLILADTQLRELEKGDFQF